jgi:transcriptional regulator with XRE-family HTH domain
MAGKRFHISGLFYKRGIQKMDSLSDLTPREALELVSEKITSLRRGESGRELSLTQIAKIASKAMIEAGRPPVTLATIWSIEQREQKVEHDQIIDVGLALKAFLPPEPERKEDGEERKPPKRGGAHILNNTIGPRVQQLRERLGLSRKDLGDLCGCTPGYLFQLETGTKEKRPSAERLEHIASVLGATTRYLVTGDADIDVVEAEGLARAILSFTGKDRAILRAVVNTMVKHAKKATENAE